MWSLSCAWSSQSCLCLLDGCSARPFPRGWALEELQGLSHAPQASPFMAVSFDFEKQIPSRNESEIERAGPSSALPLVAGRDRNSEVAAPSLASFL